MTSNSNFTITDFSVDKTTQELVSVEINGKTFSLEPTPTGASKLFAWSYIDGENVDISIYTVTETPDSGDKVIVIHSEASAALGVNKKYLTFESTESVDANSITYNNRVYERNSEKDITLVS